MSLEAKIMYGFSDIHVAKLTDGSYATPVAIEGAKSVEAELKFEHTPFYADNREVARVGGFAGGEGKLNILSLTSDEYNLLFGHTKIGKDGYIVKSNDVAPTVALMFSREKLDGTKTGYCLYNVKFKPSSIAATTMEEGKVEEEPIELEFTIGETDDRKIYYVDKVTGEFFNTVPVNPSAGLSLKSK
ncbi:phage major tail protein [[Clostridium] sordellii]|uniref:major tail protein n=1 Tax=Peptostreptococcaceae TaxID=186804 RepID=UPI0005E73E8E|nr:MULTISPECIES: major tail protein [Paeniclostridium]CEN75434.1 phage major tail protein [[Clostridium] sordellii] [Paeniclostridium sordellii]CEN94276.1 phage major tail protein [[Clostridium] sordellii] [Paeniclostridium sordellii]CEN94699.1 phage major tail protein [[Clostridium] sordellii] [Paeniclostridium sordellii]